MAITRMSLDRIQASNPAVDEAKLKATTEEDIRRHRAEDGETPDEELRIEDSISPRVVRKRLQMTQEQFASALRIPVATLRNWEQGRVQPDPAAHALLTIVARDPERALETLAGRSERTTQPDAEARPREPLGDRAKARLARRIARRRGASAAG